MKRHDTHLLSSESDKKSEEEGAHKFCFNNSYSSNDSEGKYISKQSSKHSPIHLNNLNEYNVDNNIKNNVSIISSRELKDIFCGDGNNSKSFSKRKKKKPKNNKYFIKLRKIKLNNDKQDEFEENCLTYFPTLNNDIIDKKINTERNCVSLSNVNKNNKNGKRKRDKLKFNRKLNISKDKEVLYFFYDNDVKGNQNLKNMLNVINKQKIQLLKITNNFFSIKTKKKLNIKTKTKDKIKFPLINNKKNNNSNNNKSNNNNIKDKKDNSNRNKDKYDISKNNSREKKFKINKSSININNSRIYNKNKLNNIENNITNSRKLSFNTSKQKGNEKWKENPTKIIMNNKKLFIKNNSSINFNNTLKSRIIKSPNQSIKNIISLKSKRNIEKMEELYNLYCGNGLLKPKEKLPKVKSTESIFEDSQSGLIWRKIDYEKKYVRIHNNEKENRRIITKLYNLQTGQVNHYSKHFGTLNNCPICQAVEQKNEESVRNLGVIPMIPNESSQNSLKKRRIYSAFTRINSKRNRNRNRNNAFNFISDNIYGNTSKSRSITKSRVNSAINKKGKNIGLYEKSNKKEENSNIRKLKLKRPIYQDNNFYPNPKNIKFY